ncbi:Nardilysin [Trachymyrmex septentrionalis]|uniref:Nardilysin n=1 Tax=Trachymyrmex septentrionalis TaxID=34720 RepID=A0A195EZE0_9HYME|nr:Nardilysin [Trachymyrmex septentrionalis]
MLFQAFREEDSEEYTLEEYIDHHNGTTWFSVTNEHTIFYFDIEENSLFYVLCSLCLFFFDPLISEDVFTKLDNVEDEFQECLYKYKKRHDEFLFYSFAQTGHPANKFSIDDLIKLRNNIDYHKLYNVLAKFKERHYSAHRMKLVIRSGLSLDIMEEYVTMYFNSVPNNRIPPDNFSKFKNDLPFDTPAFQKIYKVKDNRESLTRLKLTWALPSLSDFYKYNSYQYIPWILVYKGKGSLTSYLRQKMWSPSDDIILDCKTQENSLYRLIQLTIVLTSAGRKHLKDVLDAIFSFINLLKRAGPQKEIYNDIYECKQNTFRFTNYDEEPITFVRQLSRNMHSYPSNAYLTGNQFDSNYNAKIIQKYLNYLVPEMANIMILSKDFNDFELKKIEPWWYTAYTDIKISKEWIERWKVIEPLPEFFLPSPNIFLTNNHFLMPISNKAISKYPIKLYCNSVSEIWYRQDPKFCSPECCMHFYFISPLKLVPLKNKVFMTLYCKLWRELLAEELQPAILARFKYKITATIAQNMVQYSSFITNDIFENLKIRQIQIYYNLLISDPKSFINNIMFSILKLDYYSYIDMHTIIQDITLKDFQDFVKSFTERLYIQCFVQGNMMSTVAIKTVQQFIKTINCSPLHSNTIQQLRGTQIPLGISYYKIKNITKLDTTSVIRNYYQAGVTTIELSTLIYLLSNILNKKIYESPIDKFEDVEVDVVESDGILGYSITISTKAYYYTTEYIDKKIDEFLKWFKNDLKNLTEEELDVYKERFLESRSHDDANFEAEGERNWDEIRKCTYMFDLHEQEILALKKINVNNLREWVADHTPNGSNFRKLSLHVVGTISKKYVSLEYINDYQQYKSDKYHHYITKVEDYKEKLFIFPTKSSNKSS